MDLGLKNRIALVCGASSGFGKSVATRLAEEGAQVCIVSRNAEKLGKAAHEIEHTTGAEIFAISGDLSKADDINNIVASVLYRYGRIDCLLHNTGGPPAGNAFDFTDEQWLDACELLLLSYVRLTRLVLPVMAQNNWGRVLSITSSVVKEPSDLLVLSSAIRPGILAVAKSLSRQYAQNNVLINTLLPGGFSTDRYTDLLKHRSSKTGRTVDDLRAEVESAIPIGRLGLPDFFGDIAAFLLSDRNRDITGAALPVDGGFGKSLY